jgi:hypothetical protein
VFQVESQVQMNLGPAFLNLALLCQVPRRVTGPGGCEAPTLLSCSGHTGVSVCDSLDSQGSFCTYQWEWGLSLKPVQYTHVPAQCVQMSVPLASPSP